MNQNRTLDRKDIQLIELLEKNAWLTHAQIGESIHLSPSAVQRRIEKLRADEVNTGAKATVNKTKIGRGLRVLLLLELKNDSRAGLDDLMSRLNGFDEVVQVDLVSGKFDIVMTLDCVSAEHFTEFSMDQINSNENIKHCWTLMRLKKLF